MQFLTEKEASLAMTMSRSWLRQARMQGTGPDYVKIGRSVRYDAAVIETWISQRTRKATEKRGQG